MPKYVKNKRRRRHSKFMFNNSSTIEMTSSAEIKKPVKKKQNQSVFRILKGKKNANKIKRIITVAVCLILIIITGATFLFTPTGVGDMFADFTAVFSLTSKFPVTLNTSETYNATQIGNHFYVLSDGDFSCYQKNGKLSFSDAHGFSYPVISKSESRCMIYDQNGTEIKIFNAKKNLISINTDFSILAADISKNGYFAYATKSDNYTSMVIVCDEDGNKIFEWFCAEETINAVAVSPNGKNVAVTTISVENGNYFSKLYVLNYKTADPLFQKEYSGEIIYGINSDNSKNFVVIGEKFCDIISWKKFKVTNYVTEYCIDGVKSTKNHIFVSSSRENNDGNTTFEIFNNSRKKISSYVFSGIVDDFDVKGKTVFALSKNNVYALSKDGKIKRKANSGFGTIKILSFNNNSCLAIGHNDVKKITLE